MAFIPLTQLNQQFHANGVPLASGTIEFYLAGTTTPANVYSDDGGTVLGTTVTLNSEGRSANLIFRDTSVDYKYILKNAAGTEIETQDDLDLAYTGFLETNSISSGTAAAPFITMGDGATNDSDTGFYHSADNEFSFSSEGTRRWRTGNFGFDITVTGSASTPSLILDGDTNTGWFQSLADQWAFSAAGSQTFVMSSAPYAYSNSAGASGATLDLWQESSSPAIDDKVGLITFYGENDANTKTKYAQIYGKILDETNLSEDGALVVAIGRNAANNLVDIATFDNRGMAMDSTRGLSVYGQSIPDQASHIADPSGGGTVDSESRTAINAILVVLENIGFTATS